MACEEPNIHFCVQVINGLPFPYYSEFKRQNIEDTMNYRPKDGDIIITSYPKSGTTWLEYIVLQILSKGKLFPSFDDLTHKIVPFMELTGTAVVDAAAEPRIFKHHVPYNMVQKNPQSKTLYIYRNPEDVVVSYFFFLQSYDETSPLDFNIFFERFINGNIGFGRCFEHVLSFYNHREDPNLMMISYEKLHSDTRAEVLRIAKFLGEQYFKEIVQDEKLLSKIIANTSFENMKTKLYLTHPDCRDDDDPDVKNGKKKTLTFFRKGTTGDGKIFLSEPQKERIRHEMKNVLKGTSVLEEWLNY